MDPVFIPMDIQRLPFLLRYILPAAFILGPFSVCVPLDIVCGVPIILIRYARQLRFRPCSSIHTPSPQPGIRTQEHDRVLSTSIVLSWPKLQHLVSEDGHLKTPCRVGLGKNREQQNLYVSPR
jgi:hypothetical protein